ncbi:hypothetical protein BJ166DRAFT_499420 [Pestalotiopsis sp. NC0098]|nr:hypothetical protein BJ166DRAFT_499420 [Pestalotiopsis sp. NC0098]
MAFKKFAMVVLASTALAMDTMGMPGDNAETGSGPETQASVLPTAVESAPAVDSAAATLATEAAQSTPADTLTPFTNSSSSSFPFFSSANELSTPAATDTMATTAVDTMSADATATGDMTTMSTSVLTGDSMPLGTAGTGGMPYGGNNASSTGSVPVSGSDGASGVSVSQHQTLPSLVRSIVIDLRFPHQIVLIVASAMIGGLFML